MTPSRPELLSPKYRTRIGTWNVLTMYQTGKAQHLSRVLNRLGLAILGVSEQERQRLRRSKLHLGKQYSTSVKQTTTRRNEKGVAIILSKEARKSLKEWKPISERDDHHRQVLVKVSEPTIIQVCTSTNDAEEEEKEAFYHQLQTAFRERKSGDLNLVIGDQSGF